METENNQTIINNRKRDSQYEFSNKQLKPQKFNVMLLNQPSVLSNLEQET